MPCFTALVIASPAYAADASGEEAIVINGERVAQTSSATKTATPLKAVPQAVSVVTSEQIADQGMRSIADVLRSVPGATAASGEGHRDQILLRGQNTTADFFVDGIRDDVQYYRGLYNLDRVEVLKGPNAMIFGRGGGGGIVNRVTKRADGERLVAGALSLDSEGAWGAATDVGGPLVGRVAGRLNAIYETFDSFRHHVDGHRIGVNPVLGLEVGADTRIDLAYEYSNDRRVIDRGIPSDNGRPLKGAQDQFFGDPDVNRLRFDAHVADVVVEHRFSDRLRWTGKVRVGTYDKFYRNALAATEVTPAGTVQIEAYQSKTKRDAIFLQNDVVFNIDTGPIRHTLLAGLDFSSQDTFADRQQGLFDAAGTQQRFTVPLSATDQLPPIFFRDSPVRRATAADTDARSVGLYVQDQAKFGEHVEIVAGLRRDWFKLDYANRLSPTRLSRKDALWSPRLGLVIKPNDRLSLYASWSTSFLPQSGDQFSSLTASLAALEPEKFVNREIGTKWSPMRGFDVTLAAYILDRTNTRATDPVTLATVLTGEQRSKGIEASAQGKLTNRLSLTAAVALQKAEISKSTAAAPAGRGVASVPRFTASLWGRYDFSDRFGLGLGAYHQSKTFASISNAVTVPGYTRIDAAAFVEISRRLGLQFNLENLLDKDYVGLTHSDNNLTPGAPRSVRASIRVTL
ncbi:MAG: TonB-dependent siderophore receptor [Sphingomicrobium sp.]